MAEEICNESYKISTPIIILCEGAADKSFLNLIIKEGKFERFFSVPFPMEKSPLNTGNTSVSNFPEMIDYLAADKKGFDEILQGIIIIADKGFGEKKTYNKICKSFRNTKYADKIPKNINEISKGHPFILIYLIPEMDTGGGLEKLFIDAIFEECEGLKECINSYISCF